MRKYIVKCDLVHIFIYNYVNQEDLYGKTDFRQAAYLESFSLS